MITKKNSENGGVVKTILRFSPVFGAMAGLIVAALFLTLWGIHPGAFFVEMFKGALGSAKAVGNTLNRAAPYIIVGAATTIAFKCGAMNMGQEGQVFMGGLGTALVALAFPDIPKFLGIPLALLGGMAVAALFTGVSVLMRVYRGVNEVVVTLIMNYVATLIVSAMVIGPMACSTGSSYPRTDDFGTSYMLTNWRDAGHLHTGIFIAVAVAIFAIYIFWINPIGLKARAAGMSPTASLTAGINPTKVFVIGMLMNGAFCGLAGGVELLGRYNNLRSGYADGIGWDSLIVALLSGMNPKGVLPAALFFGAVYTGISTLQRTLGVPSALLSLIKGVIVIFVVTGTALQKYHKFKPKRKLLKDKHKEGRIYV